LRYLFNVGNKFSNSFNVVKKVGRQFRVSSVAQKLPITFEYLRWQDIHWTSQPIQMLYWKYFVEDNICSLIINVHPELKISKDLLPIDPPYSHAIANTHVGSRLFELRNTFI